MPGHVLDACFVEDLQTAGLLAVSCWNLESPMVGGFASSAATELTPRIAELVRYGVAIRHLTSAEVHRQLSVHEDHPALSPYDAEALVIAQAEMATLLTGDGPLRRAAEGLGVNVRGVIGELRRLIAAVIIDPPSAVAALDSIIASGSRLPMGEVAGARRQWSKMIERGSE